MYTPCSVSFYDLRGHTQRSVRNGVCWVKLWGTLCCGASSGDGRGWCSCDSRCWYLGDCCLEAPLHCFGTNYANISKISTIWSATRRRVKEKTRDCRCHHCERGNGTKGYMPVCLPKADLPFRNTICACCHGFQIHAVVYLENWLEVCPEWLAFNYTMNEFIMRLWKIFLFHMLTNENLNSWGSSERWVSQP